MGSESIRSMQAGSDEIRAMTGVRGIAALSVVGLHFFDHIGAASRPWQHAYMAVDLFFMLSGLVLALTYSSTVRLGTGREPYVEFVRKRIARIFPLYISITLLAIACDVIKYLAHGVPLPEYIEPKTIIVNLLLIQSWGLSMSVVLPAWSLSVELCAYLLFPVLVALAIPSRKAVVLAVIAVCVGLLVAAALGNHNCAKCNGFLDMSHGDTPYPLMRCVAGFTFGLIAYRLVSVPRIREIASTDLFAVLAVAGTTLAFCMGYHDLVIYVLLFATVIACYGSSRTVNLIFGNRVVYFLGTVSFSIYLVHMLLYPAVRRVEGFSVAHLGGLSSAFSVAVLFFCVLVAATVSYYLIEVPGKRFMMSLLMQKGRKDVERSSATGQGIDMVG